MSLVLGDDIGGVGRNPAFGPALLSLRYAYPTVIFCYYIISSTLAVCTLQNKFSRSQHFRRTDIQAILLFSILTYVVQIASLLIRSLVAREFLFRQDAIIGLLSCILVFGVELTSLFDSENPVWYPYIGSYLIALVFEPAIEVLSILDRPCCGAVGHAEFIDIATVATRYASLLLVLALYFGLPCKKVRESGSDTERQPLIRKDGEPSAGAGPQTEGEQTGGYGAASDTSKDTAQTESAENAESPWERRERRASEQMEKRLKEKGNWIAYARSFLIFFPYIWPVNNKRLQLRAVLVGVCLLTMNFVNVLIPRQLGIVMDSLNKINDENPWVQVLVFAGLKFVASDAGLSLLRQWLWIPVEYYSFEAMSTAAYSHVLNLSSDFHDTKSTSDTMMAIQSGQNVSNLLESVCFRAVPMLIDMGVAFVYLSVTFGPYEGLITIATAIIFLYIATKMISGLKSARRSEVSAWFEEHYVRQAGIQGWTTVACFNQIGYEERRYSAAVKDRVAKSQAVYIKYIVTYAFQYLVLLAGLLAGLFLAVYQVTDGRATPGQFIMLLTYWSQLVSPLSFFASLGKSISKDLIHAEQLLEIMQTKPTVVNKEGAPSLELAGADVRFSEVDFSYDNKKEILKDVNFFVPSGTTVAIVGPTGAGKSTVLKLLDRFYDVTGGKIEIDGQDIRDVDLYSLRSQIGVVPQAPILFDDTIMNNVRYAKLTATDEEVFEACKAASIHDQIMGFADGYNSRVGERGIKLSGGELQRVAIARAILKRPAVVLLDEATSAVDTETEQRIQAALRTLCEGRTTFIVAHRLSTIMNADRIIVVANGEVIEQGDHEELIRANGKYAELWSKQVFIKPKEKGAGEDKLDDSGVKSPSIVNDLTTELTKSELAKVKSATTSLNTLANSESGDSKGDPDEGLEMSATTTETANTPVNVPSGHKKEGSRLNPYAPAFAPQSMTAAYPTRTTGSTSRTASGDATFETDEATLGDYSSPHPHGPYAASPSVFHQAGPMNQSQSLPRDQDKCHVTIQEPRTHPTDESVELVSANSPGEHPADGLKYPRYSRRVQSKSEPFANSDDSSP